MVSEPDERPRTRVDRLAESLQIMKKLWSTGDATFAGHHYAVHHARCEPRPASPPRLIVGGGSERILTVAALYADIVGVSLPSGEKVGDLTSAPALDHFDKCLSWVREAAGERFVELELQILTIAARVVSSRRAALRIATMLGFAGDEALDLPILLIGTEDELVDRLHERRERWGFTNVVVSGDTMEVFAPVVARLAGT